MNLLDYRRYWADHHSTGPVDPIGEHHQQNRRWPDLERLCDEAESRAAHVLLAVDDHLLHADTPQQRRHLARLEVAGHGEPLRPGQSLDPPARRLLERLG